MPVPPTSVYREPLTIRRRLRQKAFIWRFGADATARRALRMDPVPADADGLFHLNARGFDRPLVVRPGPGSDDRHTFWELFFHRPYESPLTGRFRTVLDLGANVGLALAFMRYKGAPIERYVGVEPDPATFAILRKQVEVLGMAERSTLMNLAASDREATLRFKTSGESILHAVGDTGDLEVQGRPVGAILDAAGVEQVDLMKLDIEGGERAVIADAANWAHRVKFMAAELHYDMDAEWLRSHLGPLGFRVFREGELFREAVGAVREDFLGDLPQSLR